ncbi:MAG: cation:proton antiporter [Chitinophagaceae bacterium]|nr:cation:proton antiporter [Chitinophagaceae bacterium]MCW5915124.1 cation:proton antiporter [Chitinophagaceae bacterium]MCZ2396537.1 cation:proton antiporter [Chitinophagales bacterium]
MEQLPGLIRDLALILMAAAVVTIIFRKIKQPIVLGYIIAGFLVGPHLSLTPTVVDTENVETLAHIGVIFLLFSLGLEFSFKKLVRVGGAASITALVEILFITVAGYYVGRWMGWSFMDSLFLGGMLASSSTTIIIKALDELGMKTLQFARIVFGVLVVEDIVVILLMVLLSTVAVTRQFAGVEMLFTLGKLLFFLAIWFLTGIFLIPSFLKRAKSLLDDETLLVLSVGLCLGMVVFAVSVGFSAELGAFIMGSILAETTKAEKIEKLFNPVRDLFASIFFVSVGMLIDPQTIIDYKWPVLIVTLLTLFGKLISTTLGALLSGQPLKQSIQVGMSMAQIGEFAFIVATLGLSLGVISPFLFPVAVGASAITTFTTPYLIRFSEPVYNYIDRKLPHYIKSRLEHYSSSTQNIQAESKWKIVLFSYIRILLINGILLTAIVLLSVQVIIPFLQETIENAILAKVVSLIVILALSSPFLWALIAKKPDNTAYRELWLHRRYSRGPLLMIEIGRLLLGIMFVAFWLDRLFTTSVGMLIAFPLTIFLLILFSKRIQRFYQRIEFRFLTNLNEREKADLKEAAKKPRLFVVENSLATWDAHLADMEVSPHAVYIGQHLQELAWREKYGINIAYIRRGNKTIYAPKRNDRLLPYDHVGIIATDEQMENFQKIFNEVEMTEMEDAEINDVVLSKMVVNEKNRLKGQSIRGSQIREKTNGLIVGIERAQQRILNPKSDLTFEWGDIIWIVGEREKLQKFNQLSHTAAGEEKK